VLGAVYDQELVLVFYHLLLDVAFLVVLLFLVDSMSLVVVFCLVLVEEYDLELVAVYESV